MATWKDSFNSGVMCFKAQQFEDALEHFSRAIESGAKGVAVFDSRAAVYETLGNTKKALRDCKQVIDIAPDRWQGYARSARLFQKLSRFDSALEMIDMALERIKESDTKRRREFEALRTDIQCGKNSQLEKESRYARQNFYHFGQLPVEIALAIFTYALEVDPAQVVALGGVCRQWRHVMVNTPFLWATLTLSTKNPTAKAKLWRERCQGHLRTLHVRSGDSKVLWALDELKGVSLSRLHTLSLTELSVTAAQHRLPSLSTDTFAQLQSLHLSRLPLQISNYLAFDSPDMRLHTLTVHDTPLPWPKLANSCKSLVNITFHGWFDRRNLQDLFWLLHCNPNLQTFDLTMTEGNSTKYADFHCPSEPRSLPDCIDMPNLTALTLGGPFVCPSELIPRLSSPMLRSLQLSGCTGRLDSTFQHLLDSGIASSLEELVINRCALSNPGALVSVLRAAKDLRTLHLTYLAQISTVLDALSNPAPDSARGNDLDSVPTTLCPHLTHINFSHCPDVRDGILLRLVKLRNVIGQPSLNQDADGVTPTSKILSLIVDGCSTVDASILPWLRSHVPYVSCQYASRKQASWKR